MRGCSDIQNCPEPQFTGKVSPRLSNLPGPVLVAEPESQPDVKITKPKVKVRQSCRSRRTSTSVKSKASRTFTTSEPSKTCFKADKNTVLPQSKTDIDTSLTMTAPQPPVPNRPLKSAMRQPGSKHKSKYAKLAGNPIKLRFFDPNEPPYLTPAAQEEAQLSKWVPLPRGREYPTVSSGKGSKNVFKQAGRGAVTLHSDFLHRFRSVQCAEQRRREESIADGLPPVLGQLDYGNEDFKIGLQAAGVITTHDIGLRVASSVVCSKAGFESAYPGSMLVFGGYQGLFEDVAIPLDIVEAYKKPLVWPSTSSEAQLEKFVKSHFRTLQRAEVKA